MLAIFAQKILEKSILETSRFLKIYLGLREN